MKNVEFRRSRDAALAAVLAVVAMVLAACGDDSSSGSGDTVKVGLAVAQTGANASLVSQGVDVAKAWATYANEQGGLGGRDVEIVVADTKSDPAAGAAAAKQLVQNQKVSAMFVLDAVAETPIVEYLQTTDIPLLGITLGPGSQGKLKNVYGITTAAESYIPAVTVAAASYGNTSLGNVYCAESPICAGSVDVYKATGPANGVAYKGGTKVAASAPDYTAECLQLIGLDVDEIQLDLAPATGSRVAETCLKQGYKGTFGTTTASFNEKSMSGVAGAQFVGPINAFPWWVDAAPVQTFKDVMAKNAPDAEIETPVATGTWATLELLRKAMNNAPGDDVSAAAVTSALGTVKDENLDGLLPQTVTFTEGAVQPAIKCFWLAKYKAGEANPVSLPNKGTSGNGSTGMLETTCN